jgi:hypothetical protein
MSDSSKLTAALGILAMLVLAIGFAQKAPAQETECSIASEQEATEYAAKAGFHDPVDIAAAAMTVRIYKHEDHFDVFLLHLGCLIGWNYGASQKDIDNLVAELKGRPL